MRYLVLSMLLLCGTSGDCLAQQSDVSRVSIPATEQRVLHSRTLGRDFVISVALPPDYAQGSAHYPVVYVLDAKNGFLLATAIYRITHDVDLAPLIIVGIAWKQKDYFRPIPERLLDFTPTTVPGKEWGASGGAPKFAQFLRSEVFPFIDRRYRTTDDRGVIGFSEGGLFATYALLDQPDLFRRYAIGSPSLWWDNDLMIREESEIARAGKHLSGTVFLTVGSAEAEEMQRGMHALADSLRAHQPSIRLTTQVIDGALHNPIIPACLAIRALYQDTTQKQP